MLTNKKNKSFVVSGLRFQSRMCFRNRSLCTGQWSSLVFRCGGMPGLCGWLAHAAAAVTAAASPLRSIEVSADENHESISKNICERRCVKIHERQNK